MFLLIYHHFKGGISSPKGRKWPKSIKQPYVLGNNNTAHGRCSLRWRMPRADRRAPVIILKPWREVRIEPGKLYYCWGFQERSFVFDYGGGNRRELLLDLIPISYYLLIWKSQLQCEIDGMRDAKSKLVWLQTCHSVVLNPHDLWSILYCWPHLLTGVLFQLLGQFLMSPSSPVHQRSVISMRCHWVIYYVPLDSASD